MDTVEYGESFYIDIVAGIRKYFDIHVTASEVKRAYADARKKLEKYYLDMEEQKKERLFLILVKEGIVANRFFNFSKQLDKILRISDAAECQKSTHPAGYIASVEEDIAMITEF